MFHILDIKKQAEGLAFDRQLEIKDLLLERDSSILDIEAVQASGQISYDAGLYLLHYELDYTITLPSSRSMEPVRLSEHLSVSEVFIEADEVASKADMVDEELVLVIEGDIISLEESVVDNILLNIPLRVLTEAEEKEDTLPSGNSWTVMTESQYQELQEEKAVQNNPFASLNGLFED